MRPTHCKHAAVISVDHQTRLANIVQIKSPECVNNVKMLITIAEPYKLYHDQRS